MKKLLVIALLIPALYSAGAAAPGGRASVTLVTRGPVYSLAADGDRAALAVNAPGTCGRIVVWEPRNRRVVPFRRLIGGCDNGRFGGLGSVALAGTRVGWLETAGGMTYETYVVTATLARRRAVELAEGAMPDGYSGDRAGSPVGDGRLLAFNVDVICGDPDSGGDPPCPPGRAEGDIVDATVWRSARHGRCFRYAPDYPVGRCARVAHASRELTVLAVDAGRIAVRTDSGLRLLTARGARLGNFSVMNAQGAALSGKQLAVRTADAIEIYDTGSGEQLARWPVANNVRLEDLEHGILVTAVGPTVTLRRLRDGRTAAMHKRGTAHAQLEKPGLFVAGGRRVTFTRWNDVLRLLRDGG
jgi:hypothetical protein